MLADAPTTRAATNVAPDAPGAFPVAEPAAAARRRLAPPSGSMASAVGAVFAFMGSWNSFLWPLVVLRSPELQTLPVALAGLQGQFTTQWDIVMAGSVISILPMLAIYLFAQKYVIQGVANTGLK